MNFQTISSCQECI